MSFSDEFDKGHAKEGEDEEDGELSSTTTFSDLDEAALDEMYEVVDVSNQLERKTNQVKQVRACQIPRSMVGWILSALNKS